MHKMKYCYHCGISHAEENMRLHMTKTGRRWRCIKSINAMKNSEAERDAFGRMITAINEEISSATKKRRVCYEL